MYDLYNKAKNGITIAAILLILVVIVARCEEETSKPRIYPRLKTLPLISISENGVVLAADIYNLGSEPVTEHGFVWAPGYEPTLNHDRIFLGPASDTGKFSATITSSLIKDKEYIVRPFAKTRDYIVFGSPLTFKSLGSKGPEITRFEPDSARWLDTLTLYGRNFSWVPQNNDIRLNNYSCQSVSSTDTNLRVIVNEDLTDVKAKISLFLGGNTIYCNDSLKIIFPRITDINPEAAFWGDTVQIIGKNLQSINNEFSLTATIGSFSSKVVKSYPDSVLLVLPNELNSVRSLLKLKINNFVLPQNNEIQLLPPEIYSISPKEGTWGDIITLKGRFHPDKSRNTIIIGGYNADIINSKRDSISCYVPGFLEYQNNPVVCSALPFSTTATEPFKLYAPYIQSIDPLSGPTGTTCTIIGKYLMSSDRTKTNVQFGDKNAGNLQGNSTRLTFNVPFFEGTSSIKILVGKQETLYGGLFTTKNPVIESVHPLSGTFNDTVTISGRDMPSNPTIILGNGYFCEVVYNDVQKIMFRVPMGIDSIPKQAIIRLSGGYEVKSAEKFTLIPHEISFVNPKAFSPSGYFIITGKNFSPYWTDNLVYLGKYKCSILKGSATEITVKAPSSIPAGSYRLQVLTGGYRRYYSEMCQIM